MNKLKAIFTFLSNWDSNKLDPHSAGDILPVSRLNKWDEIMEAYHGGKINALQVDREVIGWLDSMDSNTLDRFAGFIVEMS